MPDIDKEILKQLNGLLRSTLTGISQYFLHARMLKHQGEFKHADHEYKVSIDAMKHADMLVEHILSLGGKPKLQELDKLAIGDESNAMFANDLDHAERVERQMQDLIALCEEKEDFVSAGLLQKMLETQSEYVQCLRCRVGAPEGEAKDCRPTAGGCPT